MGREQEQKQGQGQRHTGRLVRWIRELRGSGVGEARPGKARGSAQGRYTSVRGRKVYI